MNDVKLSVVGISSSATSFFNKDGLKSSNIDSRKTYPAKEQVYVATTKSDVIKRRNRSSSRDVKLKKKSSIVASDEGQAELKALKSKSSESLVLKSKHVTKSNEKVKSPKPIKTQSSKSQRSSLHQSSTSTLDSQDDSIVAGFEEIDISKILEGEGWTNEIKRKQRRANNARTKENYIAVGEAADPRACSRSMSLKKAKEQQRERARTMMKVIQSTKEQVESARMAAREAMELIDWWRDGGSDEPPVREYDASNSVTSVDAWRSFVGRSKRHRLESDERAHDNIKSTKATQVVVCSRCAQLVNEVETIQVPVLSGAESSDGDEPDVDDGLSTVNDTTDDQRHEFDSSDEERDTLHDPWQHDNGAADDEAKNVDILVKRSSLGVMQSDQCESDGDTSAYDSVVSVPRSRALQQT